MKKIFFLIIVVIAAALLFQLLPQKQAIHGEQKPVNALVGNNAPATAETQQTTAEQFPAELLIPKLHIQAPVEYVGMDEKRNMDIPKDDMHVAWYKLGYLPGSVGNAVIAGHLDTKTGAPAIFAELASLVPGDTIIIRNRDASQVTFVVTGKKVYSAKDFPLIEVFGPHDSARLNLITCEGRYDQTERSYTNRTVIYSELQK